MVRFHFYAVGLLAIAAMLTIANQGVLAATRETPLETAQRVAALASSGFYDPTPPRASALWLSDAVVQRDARLR
jgi:hypothetical protein